MAALLLVCPRLANPKHTRAAISCRAQSLTPMPMPTIPPELIPILVEMLLLIQHVPVSRTDVEPDVDDPVVLAVTGQNIKRKKT